MLNFSKSPLTTGIMKSKVSYRTMKITQIFTNQSVCTLQKPCQRFQIVRLKSAAKCFNTVCNINGFKKYLQITF